MHKHVWKKAQKELDKMSLVESKLKCTFFSWERDRETKLEKEKMGGAKRENAEADIIALAFFSITVEN